MRAWRDERPACARELATVFTRWYPDMIWGWIVLADTLADLACYKEGLAALRRAQRLAPPKHAAAIMVWFGHFYHTAKNLKRAELWYRRAVNKKRSTRNLIHLGATLAQQGRLRDAKRCLRSAIRIGDELVDEAELNLGFVLRAERRYSEALQHFKKALKIDPKYSLAREAIDDLRKLEASPTDP